ncbi:MAG: SDR family NAD(P)-dependent oxidoreductase [Pseudomonadota bacterium]
MSRRDPQALSEIAVTGYACRLPQAPDPKAFWSLLMDERCAVGSVTSDRWAVGRFTNPDRNTMGTAYTSAAGLVEELWDFDPGFFGISPREAHQMDPQQRMLLMVAWEAVEAAAMPPAALSGGSTGVFVGASSLDYGLSFCADPAGIEAQFMIGNTLSILSNRISYALDLKGPSFTVDTACSSSFYALHQALAALRSGEVDTAIVGGVNAILSPYHYVGFSRAAMLSPTGLCRAFDAGADGYVRAEGAVAFVLRRLDDATSGGEPVRSVLVETGINSDGRTIGLSMPSRDDQARLLRQVYGRIGVTGDALAFVEAHGTGTAVGDPIEASAIGETLGKARTAPLPIGSAKSNVGHLEAGSGMVGLLKAQLSLENGIYPSTLHVETVNPNIPCDELGLSVATRPVRLGSRPGGAPWLAGVNSFGFGGANAHAVLRQPTVEERTIDDSGGNGPMPPLVLSAATREGLQSLAAEWRDRIVDTSEAEGRRLIATAAHRRHRLSCRAVLLGKTQAAMASELDSLARDRPTATAAIAEKAEREGKTAFVYAGNGSQWAGMGAGLYAEDEAYRTAFDAVAAEFASQTGADLIGIANGADLEARLDDSEIAQPLLFALQVALTEALAAQGLRPQLVMGHSVGEVAAAWAAGALGLPDAVRLIHARSRAVHPLRGLGGMAAVLTGVEAVEQAIADFALDGLVMAGDNSPRSVTLSGPEEELKRFADLARRRRIAVRLLNVAYPYHAPAMEQVRETLLDGIQGLTPRATGETAFVSATTGQQMPGTALDAEFWWQNARQPVRFRSAVEAMADLGCRVFLEIGPRPVLQSYVSDTMRGLGRSVAVTAALDGPTKPCSSAAAVAARAVAHGARIDETAFFGPKRAAAADMPAYPWALGHYRHAPTPEALNTLGRQEDHPLLGWSARDGDPSWQALIDAERLDWLADHVVDGAAVMPAAGFAEIALAAAASLFGEGPAELSDFDILQPLAVEKGQAPRIRTQVEPETGIVRIESRPQGSDQDWLLNARGTVARAPTGAEATEAEQSAALLAVEWTGTRLYRLLGEAGLSYGPSLQLVKSLRAGAGRAVAELAAPADAGRFLVHPAGLDAALHGIFPLIAAQMRERGVTGGETFLPVRMGRLTLLARGVAAVRADIQLLRLTDFGGEASIDLTDAEGRPVARLTGLRLKRVRLSRARHDGPIAWTERMVRLASEDTARNPLPMAWADPVARLRALGLAVTPGEMPEPDAGSLLVDAACRRVAWDAVSELAVAGICAEADNDHIHCSARPLYARLLGALQEDGAVADCEATGGSSQPVLRLAAEAPYPSMAAAVDALIAEAPERSGDLMALFRVATQLPERLREGLETAMPARLAADHSPVRRVVWQALERLATDLIDAWPARRRLAILVLGDVPPHFRDRMMASDSVDSLVLSDPDGRISDLNARGLPPGAGGRCKGLALEEALAAGPYDIVLSADRFADLGEAGVPALAETLAPGALLVGVESAPDLFTDMLGGLSEGWWTGSAMADLPLSHRRGGTEWAEMLAAEGFCQAGSLVLSTPTHPAHLVTAIREPAAVKAEASAEERARHVIVFHDPTVAGASEAETIAEALGALGIDSHAAPLPDPVAPWPVPDRMTDVVVCPPITKRGMPGRGGRTHREGQRRVSLLRRLLAGGDAPARAWVVTRGARIDGAASGAAADHRPADAALRGLARVLVNEYPGTDIRQIDLDPAMDPAAGAARAAAVIAKPGVERELFLDADGALAPRVEPLPNPAVAATTAHAGAETGRILTLEREGSLDSLSWRPTSRRAPGKGEVEIAVAATGLNFRDVMWAQRLLPAEALEAGFAGPTLGMECSGVVTRCGKGSGLEEGQRVIAFAPAAFASHVTLPAAVVAPLPDTLSFEAGAALPTIFLTAQYALAELAHVAPGETVLVHGAAGGVGLAALQIARSRGARVFATAGRPEKRALVKLLGAERVFDSRSLAFADEVLAATYGEGVDVVLNSLAGEAMARSIACLRPFGRFVELGKQDYYANSRIGLRPFRQNLSYFGVDADQLVSARPDLAKRMFGELLDGFASGALSPPPLQVFDAGEAVSAFRLMQRADHVGKIVIRGPEVPTPAAKTAGEAVGNGPWLIVGGLGGFGLATARWLAAKGVERLWLTSRSGVAQPGGEAILGEIRAAGTRVETCAVDVCDREAMEVLIARIEAEGCPVEGVVHAAMVLDDAPFAELDPRRFDAVMRPKFEGAQLLDRVSRQLSPRHFLLYSSVTTLFGNPGQAPYVAANAALESLAAQRRAAGLPALAIAWGPIRDQGYLAREAETREFLARRLDDALMSADEALAGLGALLAAPGLPPMVAYAPMQWGRLADDLPMVQSTLFSLVDRAARRGSGSAHDFLAELEGLDDDAARKHIQRQLIAETARILRQPEGDLDPYRPLTELGFDSLMAVDLKMSAEEQLGISLPLMTLGDQVTLADLAQKVLTRIRSTEPGEAGSEPEGEMGALVAKHVAIGGGEEVQSAVNRIAEQVRRAGGGGS